MQEDYIEVLGLEEEPRRRRWLVPTASAVLLVSAVVGVAALRSEERAATGQNATYDAVAESAASSDSPREPATADLVDLDELLLQLLPSGDHTRLMWEAREVVISDCMTEQGYTWVARPSGDSSEEWAVWQEWYDSLVAGDPAFESALLGQKSESGALESGCQLAAYNALHRDGVSAEARAADLYNEAAGVALSVEGDDPEAATKISAALTEWLTENSDRVAALQRDIATEIATAKQVLK